MTKDLPLPDPPRLQSAEDLDHFGTAILAELATEFVNERSRILGLELDVEPISTPVSIWYQNKIPSNDKIEQQETPIADAAPDPSVIAIPHMNIGCIRQQ